MQSKPTDEQMRQYLQGTLTGADLAFVEGYLQVHADSADVAEVTIIADPLLQPVGEVVATYSEKGEHSRGTVEQLMQRLINLPSEPGAVAGTRVRYFGDFELFEELGRGGMGVVLRAKQVTLQREVALKMILAGQLASPEAVERFRSEAQAAAHLDHPHIVPIYEVGKSDNYHYFSMKLISGRSLAELHQEWCVIPPGVVADSVSIGQMRSRERKAASLVKLLANAIHYAHQRGVLHRDLKPSNVLVDHSGKPFITDFGLAKRLDVDSTLTASNAIVGTPSYMSPEQAAGAKGITIAVDIYGLGTILYELLTGRRVFTSDSALQLLKLVQNAEPTHPRAIDPRLHPDLETICLKCLQKDPEQRYPHADALQQDLQRFLNGEPIVARKVSAIERLRSWCRRNPLIASLTAGVFLSLALGTGVSSYFAIVASEQAVSERTQRGIAERKEREARLATEAETVAKKLAQTKEGEAQAARKLAQEREQEAKDLTVLEKEARGQAERSAKEARIAEAEVVKKADALRHQVYRNTISLAYREWLSDNGPQAAALLNSCEKEFRGWEWKYLSRLTNLHLLEMRKDPNEEFGGAAFSQDGTRIATAGELGSVVVWDAVTGQEIFSVKFPKPENARSTRRVDTLKYSPDGTKLLVSGVDSQVRLLDAENGKELATYPGFDWGVCNVAFSPDGRRVAACGGHEGVVHSYTTRIWDTESRELLLNLVGHSHSVNGIAFSPDGERLASAGQDRCVRVWDLKSGRTVLEMSSDAELVGVTYSLDGSRILVGGSDSKIHVWDAKTGEQLKSLQGHREMVRTIAGSPDGRRYVTGSVDATAAIWNAETGERLWTLQGHYWNVNSAAFSRDGRRIVTAGADRRAKVWDATSDRQFQRLTAHRSSIWAMELSRDGRYAASMATQGGSVTNEYALWDLASGELIRCDARFGVGFDNYLPYFGLDFGPDLKLAAGGSNPGGQNECRVWDALTGRTINNFAVKSHVHVTALSPDGLLMALGGNEGTVQIHDPATGELKHTWSGDQGALRSLRFSPDGRMLVSCGMKSTIIWDLQGNVKRTITARNSNWRGRAVEFSSDSKRIAVIGYYDAQGKSVSNAVTIIDIESGDVVAVLQGHSRPVNSIHFTPDGSRVATGSNDNLIKIWDVARASELLTLRGHTAGVLDVKFTPDGVKLVSASVDASVIIWDTAPVKAPAGLKADQLPKEVRSLVYQLKLKNPRYTGGITDIEIAQGEVVHLSFEGQYGLKDIGPIHELRHLASLNLRNTGVADVAPLIYLPLKRLILRNTNVSDLRPLRRMPLEQLDLRGTPVADLSPLSGLPLVRLWIDAHVKYDDSFLSQLPKLETINGLLPDTANANRAAERVLAGHVGEVLGVAFHPSGRFVASGGIDGTLRRWDVDHLNVEPLVLQYPAAVTSVEYSPDGRWVSWCTGDSRQGTLSGSVWIAPADDLQAKRELLRDQASMECLAFDHTGRHLAVGSADGIVRLWESESGNLISTWTGHKGQVLALAFSPDDQTLAMGMGNWSDQAKPAGIVLRKIGDGTVTRTYPAAATVRSLQYSANGTQLLAAVSDWVRGTHQFDVATGMDLFQIRTHDGHSTDQVLLNEGKCLVTVGEDPNIVFWDLATQTKLHSLSGPSGKLLSISSSADSRHIATAGSDGIVRLWTVPEAIRTKNP